MYKRGFTLIELMVVMSIMAMLSSLIIASVQSARDKGRVAAGLKFERHTYDLFSDSVLAEYNFDVCGGGSSVLNFVPNISGPATFNLLAGPSIEVPTCVSALSSDTPNREGKSLNLAELNGTQYFTQLEYPWPASNVRGSKFAIGFWAKIQYGSGYSGMTMYVHAAAPGQDLEPFLDFNIGKDGSVARLWDNNSFSDIVTINISNTVMSKIFDGKWHYVYASFNNNLFSLYIDGNKAYSTAAVIPAFTITEIEDVSILPESLVSGQTFRIDHLTFFGNGI